MRRACRRQSSGANATTRFRPWRLARYIAQSALSSSSSRRDGVVGEAGDADAHRERLAAGVERPLFEARPDALADGERLRARRLDEDDDELLAAVAGGDVDAAHRLLDDVRDLAQRRVAGAVTVAVVVLLEVVEVAEQDRERLLVLPRAGELLAQALVQVAVVVEAGERVGDRVDLGPAEAHRGGLQHRGERLARVGAEGLAGRALERRQVGDHGGDHVALERRGSGRGP